MFPPQLQCFLARITAATVSKCRLTADIVHAACINTTERGSSTCLLWRRITGFRQTPESHSQHPRNQSTLPDGSAISEESALEKIPYKAGGAALEHTKIDRLRVLSSGRRVFNFTR